MSDEYTNEKYVDEIMLGIEYYKKDFNTKENVKELLRDVISQIQFDSLSSLSEFKTIMQGYGDHEAVLWEDIQDKIDELERKERL